MSNQIVKNERQAQIQKAFLGECSLQRLATIVGEENTKQFLSDFITLADQYPKAPLDQLARCCVEIASLKLPILKQAGQAYIVPRGGVYNVEIGYKGWLVLAKRVGIAVRTYAVFKGDEYSFEVDDFDQKFRFKPSQENIDRWKNNEFINQNLLCIAVVVKDSTTGIVSTELVDFYTLKRMKEKSSGQNTTYNDWLLEMYRAKAIKYVLRKMPIDTMDSTIFRAFAEDDKGDDGYHETAKRVQNNSLGSAFSEAQVSQEVEPQAQEQEQVQEQVQEQEQAQEQEQEQEQNDQFPVIDLNLDQL